MWKCTRCGECNIDGLACRRCGGSRYEDYENHMTLFPLPERVREQYAEAVRKPDSDRDKERKETVIDQREEGETNETKKLKGIRSKDTKSTVRIMGGVALGIVLLAVILILGRNSSDKGIERGQSESAVAETKKFDIVLGTANGEIQDFFTSLLTGYGQEENENFDFTISATFEVNEAGSLSIQTGTTDAAVLYGRQVIAGLAEQELLADIGREVQLADHESRMLVQARERMEEIFAWDGLYALPAEPAFWSGEIEADQLDGNSLYLVFEKSRFDSETARWVGYFMDHAGEAANGKADGFEESQSAEEGL